MRIALALAPLLLGSTAFAAPTPMEAPQRMPGLWLMQATAATPAGSTSYHVCVGAGADDVLRRPGSELANCREQAWTKDAHYTYFSAVCEAGSSTASVKGRFGGDFKYNFQGELTTTYAPARDGVSAATIELEGRRLGPCRADQPVGKLLLQGQEGVGNLNLGEPLRPAGR